MLVGVVFKEVSVVGPKRVCHVLPPAKSRNQEHALRCVALVLTVQTSIAHPQNFGVLQSQRISRQRQDSKYSKRLRVLVALRHL